MQPFYIHNHTQYSNLRLRDSIIKENLLIDEAIQLGLPGLAITDHESLASHVKALKYMDKLKKEGKDKFTIVGILSMLLFQQIQNIGMNIGLLPITGITLPFISYGGSSLVSYMVMIGIILNINKN